MTTIYVVVSDQYDGECSYYRMMKAFRDKDNAEKHVDKCKEESKRIFEKVQAHYDLHAEELDFISETLMNLVRENSKKKIMMDYSKIPESIRRREIQEMELKIFREHKYDPSFLNLDEHIDYLVQEVDLE